VGVDPVKFQPAPEPPGPPVVLLSGRLLWDKGVGVLAEAARILHRKQAVRIALAGEPDPGNPASLDTATLESWAARGLVEWWGWQAEMGQVYPRCHIVAAPTMYGEGVPTVLLEAGACARPAVTTDMPGCREVISPEVNGLIVPPNDAPALAAALERLILDPGLRGRMGQAARQMVLERYTVNQINAATLAVYSAVLAGDRLPQPGTPAA
jgi:glycosyltransferase involved in cell wall biosynthesis